MELENIFYEGIKLTVLFKFTPAEEQETETGFKGTFEWKEIQAITVGGVDITALLEQHLETIENKINGR